MANDLNGSPYKVDTAAVLTTGDVFVIKMVWQEPAAAAAQDLTVLDRDGRTLWDENAYTGGTGISIEQDINQFCYGINVSVIDSGTLYIYYG